VNKFSFSCSDSYFFLTHRFGRVELTHGFDRVES